MNRPPAAFRSNRQPKSERWQAQLSLLRQHGSWRFLAPTPRRCPGVEPDANRSDWIVLVGCLILLVAMLVW